MKILCGIIANDAARFSEFWSCVLRLKVPAGSIKDQVIGGDWCSARNELAQRCLDEGYDYLWFMDDDHSFAPDLLQKLLEASITYDLPIVNPLCTTRTAPFHLVTYAANPDPNSTDRYLPISLTDVPGEGIVELEAGGCAGMLIRRDVLAATGWNEIDDYNRGLPGNWFEYTDKSEDIVFCEKAKAAGFKIYADLSCRLGHITTAVIMPGTIENEWITGLTVGRDFQVAIPRAEVLLKDQELAELQASSELTVDEFVPLAVEPAPVLEDVLPGPIASDPVLESTEEMVPPFLSPSMNKAQRIEPIPDPEIFNGAERIEIWLDDELRWWWRAIDIDGRILRKDSGVNEEGVIGAAHFFYQGAPVYQVQREVDDSRNLRQYGVPGRIWDR